MEAVFIFSDGLCVLILSEREDFGGRLWIIYPRRGESFFAEDFLLVFFSGRVGVGGGWGGKFSCYIFVGWRRIFRSGG